MKLKIVLFLLLMTSLCHADDYSWQCQDYYVYSEENGDCEPTLLFLKINIPKSFNFGFLMKFSKKNILHATILI